MWEEGVSRDLDEGLTREDARYRAAWKTAIHQQPTNTCLHGKQLLNDDDDDDE